MDNNERNLSVRLKFVPPGSESRQAVNRVKSLVDQFENSTNKISGRTSEVVARNHRAMSETAKRVSDAMDRSKRHSSDNTVELRKYINQWKKLNPAVGAALESAINNGQLEEAAKLADQVDKHQRKLRESTKKSAQANHSFVKSMEQGFQGSTKLARGVVLLTAANEENARSALQMIARFEGVVQGVQGAADAYKSLTSAIKTYNKVRAIDDGLDAIDGLDGLNAISGRRRRRGFGRGIRSFGGKALKFGRAAALPAAAGTALLGGFGAYSDSQFALRDGSRQSTTGSGLFDFLTRANDLGTKLPTDIAQLFGFNATRRTGDSLLRENRSALAPGALRDTYTKRLAQNMTARVERRLTESIQRQLENRSRTDQAFQDTARSRDFDFNLRRRSANEIAGRGLTGSERSLAELRSDRRFLRGEISGVDKGDGPIERTSKLEKNLSLLEQIETNLERQAQIKLQLERDSIASLQKQLSIVQEITNKQRSTAEQFLDLNPVQRRRTLDIVGRSNDGDILNRSDRNFARSFLDDKAINLSVAAEIDKEITRRGQEKLGIEDFKQNIQKSEKIEGEITLKLEGLNSGDQLDQIREAIAPELEKNRQLQQDIIGKIEEFIVGQRSRNELKGLFVRDGS